MSEAMTNSEIEDVLSSIRRLVAQESRAAPSPQSANAGTPEPRSEVRPAPDRLVLTAELRVGQANLIEAPTMDALAFPSSAGTPSDTTLADVRSVPKVASALSRVNHLIAAEALEKAPVTPDTPLAEPEPVPLTPHADLEAAITELEAALGPARPMGSANSEPPVDIGDGGHKPDTDPADDDAGEAYAGVHAAATLDTTDIAIIDEDDLKHLVARLVREELRGQLGERITQQVRKLVRAEIARALDDRNLLG